MKYKDKKWLEEEYINKQRSMLQMAKELCVSTMTVRKYILRYGFPIRDKNQQRSITIQQEKDSLGIKKKLYKVKPKNKLLLDKGWLEKEYVENGKALREIAAACGRSSRRGIVRALKFHNIPIRDIKEARKNRSKKGKELRHNSNELVNNIEYIKKLYESGLSMQSIADKLKIGCSSVAHRLKMADVTPRPSWEHRIGTTHSQDVKEKMSKTAVEQVIRGERTSYSNSQRAHTLFPDGTFRRVRSSYEKHYAEYLKTYNIPFKYEAVPFHLSDGSTYIPDFYLPDTDEYIEIKGYLSEKQSDKYVLFREDFPDIKWRILYKEDLKELGIVLDVFKSVYMVCGVSGSGKSWVCQQLAADYDYVSFDGVRKKNHINALRSTVRNVLYDPNIKISTFIKRHSHEFDVIPVFIIEDESVIRQRLMNRGGKFTPSIQKRMQVMIARKKKYAHFSGTSSEVLNFLKMQIKE